MKQTSSHRLRYLAIVLLALVSGTLWWALWQLGVVFLAPTFEIAVPTAAGEIVRLDLAAMAGQHRLWLGLLLMVPELFWITGLGFLTALGVAYYQGDVFGRRPRLGLRGFAGAMLIASLVETTQLPCALLYLGSTQLAEVTAQPWDYLDWSGSLMPMIGSVLVLLVTEIMAEAERLHDEANLTI